MPQRERDIFIRDLFSMVAPYVDHLSTAFSFGLCHMWRRMLVSLSGVKRNDKVLDICTGTGELAELLIRKVGPEGSLTGVDFCEDMLRLARQKMGRERNVSFFLCNAKDLAFPDNSFDLVTVAFGMRNISDTALALGEVYRVLKPGGRFYCLELTKPVAGWFLPIYKWYVFKIIPPIAKLFTKTSLPYSYLPVSIETFYSPGEFRKVIEDCGFSDVKVYSLSLGIATIYGAVKHG